MGNALGRPSNSNQEEHPELSARENDLARKRHINESTFSPPTPTKDLQPKRKRLRSTSQYIYDALFVHGENSDVTISSLDRKWNLHKVYLRQAGYFKSMFHKSQWKESSMTVIDLQIPDSNIDENALDITFGSLYSEEVLICPEKVVSILAAASLIQLEGLMQQCAEVMKEAVCLDNVCLYYKTACMYGQNEVAKNCMAWLETNLMTSQSLDLLRELEPNLLTDVINSPNLIVIQIEMDIYTILKKWLYLKLNPEYSGEFKGILTVADNYFRELAKTTTTVFLDSQQGQPYIQVFQALRLQHIIRDFVSCRELEKDLIIPWSWLSPLYRQQWLSMLREEQSLDAGPKICDEKDFECNGLRCGRLLLRDTDHCWRWNGYNFGLDLLVSYSSQFPKTISLRRNVQSQRCSSSVNFAQSRNIIFRMHVASVNDKGHTILRLSTGNMPLTLEKEEEKVILTIDKELLPENVHKKQGGWNSCFPLLIAATFQLVSGPTAPEMSDGGYAILPLPNLNLSTPTLGEAEIGDLNKDDDDPE
uniref:germ cell-less protein-like 1 n=1 Tax=Styela clava TaxID=7725 RepID=UPI0019397ACA|nr:germ cell-less protein-like 1 [Styela clava]